MRNGKSMSVNITEQKFQDMYHGFVGVIGSAGRREGLGVGSWVGWAAGGCRSGGGGVRCVARVRCRITRTRCAAVIRGRWPNNKIRDEKNWVIEIKDSYLTPNAREYSVNREQY